jgi:D-alanyl-D-alanine carboxypeptidase
MRNYNSLIYRYPGADGMKTGFICDSGFNIVISATREGRKLVAIILGEPSTASRRERAVDLLDNGFKRYFWKSLFGTSLDGLAIQASLSTGPTHLRDSVCGVGKPRPPRKRGISNRKPKGKKATLRGLDPAAAVNATTDAAAAATKNAVKATTKTLRKTVTTGSGN